MKKIILILAIACYMGMQVEAQTTRYVKSGASGNGTSWSNASGNLQAVINASALGDTIFIAKGIYKPQYTTLGYNAATNTYPTTDGARDNAFVLKAGVKIYGGFDPGNGITDLSHNRILPDTSGTLKGTIFSGDIGAVGNSSDNCYHVVIGADISILDTTVLDGITITGGNANGSGYIIVNSKSIKRDYSGGMYNNSSSPKLTHVMISENTATGTYSYSGGMYNYNSSPELTHVIITKNIATHSGGGMYNSDSSPVLTHVIISKNTVTFAYGSGGGIHNSGNFTFLKLTDVTISGNTSAGYGGGISYSNNSSSELTNVKILGNTATMSGGGIYNDTSFIKLTNVTISGNTTTGSGGGIYNNKASSELTDMTISKNTAGSSGGGMYNFGGSYSHTLNNITISENTATNYGGGICNAFSSSSKLTDVTISGNTAYRGGGMYNDDSPLELTNATISENTATGSGGGIYLTSYSSHSFKLTHVTISKNTAAASGGGISNVNAESVLKGVTISGNTAAEGGGIYNSGSVYSSTLNNVTISENIATTSGGGIFNSMSSPLLTNVRISGNIATTSGGAVYNYTISETFPASPIFINVTISGNMAAEGGGIWNRASSTFRNSIIWGNTLTDETTEDNIFNSSGHIINYYYSLVGGMGIIGGIILNEDPLFVNTADGDYRLLPNSPCINVGNNNLYHTSTYGDKDLAGNHRIVGDTIDLGAYEWQGFNNNATLASLTVSEGTLTPAFSPTTTNYTVNVGNSITSITITAQAEDAYSVISGDTGTHSLSEGSNSFSVTVTAEDGITTATYNVTVNRSTVGIGKINAEHSIRIYPNPTTGQLTIESGESGMEHIAIYGISGRVLQIFDVFKTSKVFDISHLPSGIYFVKIKTAEGEVIRKVLKQ